MILLLLPLCVFCSYFLFFPTIFRFFSFCLFVILNFCFFFLCNTFFFGHAFCVTVTLRTKQRQDRCWVKPKQRRKTKTKNKEKLRTKTQNCPQNQMNCYPRLHSTLDPSNNYEPYKVVPAKNSFRQRQHSSHRAESQSLKKNVKIKHEFISLFL